MKVELMKAASATIARDFSPSIFERFWPQVDVRGPEECWEWRGLVDASGYGLIVRSEGVKGRELAHRLAYLILVGDIPEGESLKRRCRNKLCCNPAHMEFLVYGVNSDRYTPEQQDAAFWACVDKSDPNPDACWPWKKKSRSNFGYGVFYWRKKLVGAHRLAWILTHGAIPEGMCVLHRCDFPPCCRPAHLFLGTRIDNNNDCIEKGRRVNVRGAALPISKLTEAIVYECRVRHKYHGVSLKALSIEFGVAPPTMWQAVSPDGSSWRYVPFP